MGQPLCFYLFNSTGPGVAGFHYDPLLRVGSSLVATARRAPRAETRLRLRQKTPDPAFRERLLSRPQPVSLEELKAKWAHMTFAVGRPSGRAGRRSACMRLAADRCAMYKDLAYLVRSGALTARSAVKACRSFLVSRRKLAEAQQHHHHHHTAPPLQCTTATMHLLPLFPLLGRSPNEEHGRSPPPPPHCTTTTVHHRHHAPSSTVPTAGAIPQRRTWAIPTTTTTLHHHRR